MMNAFAPLRKLPEPQVQLRDQLLVALPNNLGQEDLIWLECWTNDRMQQSPDLAGLIIDCTAVSCTDVQDLRQLETWLVRLKSQGARVSITGISSGLAALIALAGLQLICDEMVADLNTLLARG